MDWKELNYSKRWFIFIVFISALIFSLTLINAVEEVPFSRIVEELNNYNVESLLITDRPYGNYDKIEATLKDRTKVSSEISNDIYFNNPYSLIKEYGLDCDIEDRFNCDKLKGVKQIYDSTIPFSLVIFLSFLFSAIICLGITFIYIIKFKRDYNNKFGVLTYLSLSLITYGMILFSFFIPLVSGRGFSFNFLTSIGFFGWIFAIPALIMAIIGISNRKYKTLNLVTLIMAILVLLFFIFTMGAFGG